MDVNPTAPKGSGGPPNRPRNGSEGVWPWHGWNRLLSSVGRWTAPNTNGRPVDESEPAPPTDGPTEGVRKAFERLRGYLAMEYPDDIDCGRLVVALDRALSTTQEPPAWPPERCPSCGNSTGTPSGTRKHWWKNDRGRLRCVHCNWVGMPQEPPAKEEP